MKSKEMRGNEQAEEMCGEYDDTTRQYAPCTDEYYNELCNWTYVCILSTYMYDVRGGGTYQPTTASGVSRYLLPST